MVNVTTPSLPGIFESGRDDNQAKQESNIPDVDATNNDQSIPNFGDKSEADEKRKASLLKGANDIEVGSSSSASDPSAPPPSKKRKLTIDVEDLAKD
ncbi:unnamed protein product [Lactuca saligna]|uniref:Uncharacterized protein n=1 Tax=Lactuca saligna TaxID=75948 RepID=A0AA36E6G5_LACSI|nr:unnamed protein product [Lactuca saligna]